MILNTHTSTRLSATLWFITSWFITTLPAFSSGLNQRGFWLNPGDERGFWLNPGKKSLLDIFGRFAFNEEPSPDLCGPQEHALSIGDEVNGVAPLRPVGL